MNSAMHSSIHKVFEAVQDLEPLSPSATPGTIRAFTETTDEFYKYTGLMHFHLSAIREASGIDSHCDWDEPEAPYIKAPVVCFIHTTPPSRDRLC
ncbi:hypothetical protein M413DRAFT_443755 [Hebeloma cylindrosporum]|uniref:Uncharacterized protein n=1 Tax=Hebeloma cylindrosporum TaxID=76867 RepID=A0A0C3C4S8_HEBCY|nr:hypothetical protein M413DRAFT_443755 [Hebeloma cylindrosporum h7]